MQEELNQIDTSTIDELRRLKESQEVLADRLARMEDRRSDVSPAVFERVRADYEARQSALEEEARPLKERARTEYARLADCDRRITEALEAARLDKEELSFRNDLGEFEEDDFRDRMEQADEALRQREADQAASQTLKERFVEAFHSEEELVIALSSGSSGEGSSLDAASGEPVAFDGGPPEEGVLEDGAPVLEAEPADGHSEEGTSEEGVSEATVVEGDEDDGHPMKSLQELADLPLDVAAIDRPAGSNGNAAHSAIQEALDNDETIPTGRVRPVIAPEIPASETPTPVAATEDPPKESEITAELPVPDPPTFEAAAPPTDSPTPDLPISGSPAAGDSVSGDPADALPDAPAATVIARRARLLVEDSSGGPEEYLLSMSQVHTSIGRSPGNTICIAGEGISGHHAEIVFGPQGFTLHDLKSLAGTFVNGEKVTRHLLTDGDVIRAGAVQLAFRNL